MLMVNLWFSEIGSEILLFKLIFNYLYRFRASTLVFVEFWLVKNWFFIIIFLCILLIFLLVHDYYIEYKFGCITVYKFLFSCVEFAFSSLFLAFLCLLDQTLESFFLMIHSIFGKLINLSLLFCASDCLDSRLGQRFLGRGDDSGVSLSRANI